MADSAANLDYESFPQVVIVIESQTNGNSNKIVIVIHLSFDGASGNVYTLSLSIEKHENIKTPPKSGVLKTLNHGNDPRDCKTSIKSSDVRVILRRTQRGMR